MRVGIYRLIVLVWGGALLVACGDDSSLDPAPDDVSAPSEETAMPQPGPDIGLDTSEPSDLTPAPFCEEDHHCDELAATLGPCERAVCDSVQSRCVVALRADYTPCDDDDPCTSGSICLNGVCQRGVSYDCDYGGPCFSGKCDGRGGCFFVPKEAGTPCDDGNRCTHDEVCDGEGRCVGSPGDDCPCDTSDDCALLDDDNLCSGVLICSDGRCQVDPKSIAICDPAADTWCRRAICRPSTGLCEMEVVREGEACDDGNPCSSEGICRQGECVAETNRCSCRKDEDCRVFDTDDRCHGHLECVDDECVIEPDSIVLCAPLEPHDCTLNVCDPESGQCEIVEAHDGHPCDDGNPCTRVATCRSGVCVGVGQVSCDDGNPCTDNLCDPEQGCYNPDNLAPCDDGNACTRQSRCEEGRCRAGEPIDCDDGDPCTANDCNPDHGCFSDPLSDVPCDIDPCTTGDTCVDGVCLPGDPIVCDDDDDPCTEATCIDGACHHIPIPNCEPPTEIDCETMDDCVDDDPCTIGECGPDGKCEFAELPNGTLCQDGDLCSGGSTCMDGMCIGGEGGLCAGRCNPLRALECGTTVSDNTLSPSGNLFMENYSCLPSPLRGHELVYTITAQVARKVTLTLTSDEQLALLVLRAATPTSSCNPDCCIIGDLTGEPIELTVQPNEVYFVVVDGLKVDDGGSFELTMSCRVGEDCTSGVDDDGDGLTDCDDPDCALAVACGGPVCVDDNGDPECDPDNPDCDDPACADHPDCQPPECIIEQDELGHWWTDCHDPACAGQYPCTDLCHPQSTLGCGKRHPVDTLPLGIPGNFASCLPERTGGGAPQVFGFVATRNGTVTVTLRGASFDAALYALNDPCLPTETCIGASDSGGPGSQEVLQFYALAGRTYFIVVDGDDGQEAAPGAPRYELFVGCAGGREVLCDNGVDDNGNGLVDCADPDCLYDEACAENDCSDGIDNNNNGLTDCADPSCALDPACLGWGCVTGYDGLGNEIIDCNARGCFSHPMCREICGSGKDEDGDGLTDCDDPDCDGHPFCREDCTSGVDDDGDGFIDCEDPDCVMTAHCVELLCDDGIDNDGDGFTDCDDLDCIAHPACREVDCDDGIDNDGDGFTDCDDPDCSDHPACRDKVCRPAHGVACGKLEGLELNSPLATNAFASYPTCDPMSLDTSGPELAFEFVAPCSGFFSISAVPTETLEGDIALMLLDGEGSCRPISCLDIGYGLGGPATVQLEAALGQRHIILIDGVEGYDGSFDLEITCGCDPIIETVCDDGIDHDGDGLTDCQDPDCADDIACTINCTPARDVVCGESFLANVTAGDSTNEIDHYPACDTLGLDYRGRETAFRFTAPCNGPVMVTTTRTSGSGLMDTFVLREDWEGRCSPDNCVATGYMSMAGVGQVAFAGLKGANYYIVVDTQEDTTGTYRFAIDCTCRGEWDCDDGIDNDGDGLTDCDDPDCADAWECRVPETCEWEAEIGCGETAEGDTGLYGTHEMTSYSCKPNLAYEGVEHIYRFVAPARGFVSVLLDIRGDHDLDLFVLRDWGDGCTPDDCIVASTTGQDESLAFLAEAGAVYYLVVDGYQGAVGPYRLIVDCVDGCTTQGELTCDEALEVDLNDPELPNRLSTYSCDGAGGDYWGAEFIAEIDSPCTGWITARAERISPDDGAFDLFWLVDGTPCAGSCRDGQRMDLSTGVAELPLYLTKGRRIVVALDGRDGAKGEVRLSLDCEECLAPNPCYGAQELACGDLLEGHTGDDQGVSPGFDFYGCSPWAWTGPEVVRVLTPTTSGLVTLSVSGGPELGVFVLEEHDERCDPFLCTAHWDLRSDTLSFYAEAGQRYYLVVDNQSSLSGAPFEIQANCP